MAQPENPNPCRSDALLSKAFICIGDDVRVHDYEGRARWIKLDNIACTLWGVENRQCRTGRIIRCECRHDNDWNIESPGNAFASIDRFAATDSDQAINVLIVQRSHMFFYFR